MIGTKKTIFLQIFKIDEEKRQVSGLATSEALDNEGEIFDYDSSKPYFEQWSAATVERSQGKSYGNIREMHQLSAVGLIAEPIVFDDDLKVLGITTYISDDDAWKKCLDGTYTGFSINGNVVGAKWMDKEISGAKRYTVKPVEISVVDNPCNPEAVFTAVKADGSSVVHKFKQAAAAAALEDPMAKPVAAKAQTVSKSMWSISDLVSVINQLRWVQDDLAWEADVEGDGSPVPAKLKAAVSNLVEVLQELTVEESTELVAAMKAAKGTTISKKGAKHSKATLEAVGKCSAALGEMGKCFTGKCDHAGAAKCMGAIEDEHKAASDALAYFDGAEPDEDDAAEKAATSATAAPPTTKVSGGEGPGTGEEEMDEVTKAQVAKAATDSAEALTIAKANAESIEKTNGLLEKLINTIANEPAAPKVHTGAGVPVSKTEDLGTAAATTTVGTAAKTNNPQEIAKAIVASGGTPVLGIGR